MMKDLLDKAQGINQAKFVEIIPRVHEPSKLYDYEGQDYSVGELAQMFGLRLGTLRDRLNRGDSVEKAIRTPIQTRARRK